MKSRQKQHLPQRILCMEHLGVKIDCVSVRPSRSLSPSPNLCPCVCGVLLLPVHPVVCPFSKRRTVALEQCSHVLRSVDARTTVCDFPGTSPSERKGGSGPWSLELLEGIPASQGVGRDSSQPESPVRGRAAAANISIYNTINNYLH